jgi:hypothetical protein
LLRVVAIGHSGGRAGKRDVKRKSAADGGDATEGPVAQRDGMAERQWIARLDVQVLPNVIGEVAPATRAAGDIFRVLEVAVRMGIGVVQANE